MLKQRPMRIPNDVEILSSNPESVRAGDRGAWTLNFKLARDISSNQNLWLCIYGRRSMKIAWEGLQAEDDAQNGFVSLATESNERLKYLSASDDFGVFSFAFPEGGLKKGECLSAELKEAEIPKFSNPDKFFILMTADPDEETTALPLYGANLDRVVGVCMMNITGNDIASIAAYAPSSAVPGQEFSILVKPEDKFQNVSHDEPGNLIVRLEGEEIQTKRTPLPDSTCCRLEGIKLPKEGVFRLEAEDAYNGFIAVSNPIKCLNDSEESVLWGSMHCHTEMSDGTGSLDRSLRSMRDENAIDFGATADHDHAEETPDDFWLFTQDKVIEYNEPGRFTVFLGFEWAKWRRLGDGDKNVYYLRDRRPILRSEDDACPHASDLYRCLKNETALIIPHHPAHIGNHCDWKNHDPEKERLVEIYSLWGCSERSAEDGNIYPGKPVDNARAPAGENPLGYIQRAMALGWRIGFTANSDDHTGHGSDRVPRSRGQRGGLTAVYATANTREAIWKALWDRKCYATTGERIVADFQLDDHPMGSILKLSEHPQFASERKMKLSVHCTAPVTSVEIVRNNKDIYVAHPNALDFDLEWADMEPLEKVNLPPAEHSPEPFTFYYLRITQEDRGMAWISPIWIIDDRR